MCTAAARTDLWYLRKGLAPPWTSCGFTGLRRPEALQQPGPSTFTGSACPRSVLRSGHGHSTWSSWQQPALKASTSNKIEKEYLCACSCAMTRGMEVNFLNRSFSAKLKSKVCKQRGWKKTWVFVQNPKETSGRALLVFVQKQGWMPARGTRGQCHPGLLSPVFPSACHSTRSSPGASGGP